MLFLCGTLSLFFHLGIIFYFFSAQEKEVNVFSLETSILKTEEHQKKIPGKQAQVKSENNTTKEASPEAGPLASLNEGGVGEGNRAGEISDAVEAKPLQSLEPEYPELSRRKKEEGLCIVFVVISDKGEVLDAKIEKSSGFIRLDQSALEQVKRTQFLPAKQKNENVLSKKKIIFNFELK